MMPYREKLERRIAACQSHLCVGLDPRPELMFTDPKHFLAEVVEETSRLAAAYKPNAAYFEAMGVEGMILLEYILERIPSDIPVIFDGKRGDIGETQKYYGRACFEVLGADAVTVNPYMGRDCLEPLLEYEDRGIYLLAVTSNAGANDLQLKRAEGRFVFEWVQDLIGESEQIGLVVGLTQASDGVLSRLRDVPLLVPGLGAQGGDIQTLAAQHRKAPILVNVSRGILFQEPDLSFEDKAQRYAREIEIALAQKPAY
jgi:orotidine-5'-phosphate decarboxylase